ncbi:hypothetical protein [Streptomyces sp. BV129]|uniref:hypothetical protein n=1 Tax=Streptomyces sp. BV129 TaxID=2849671 RepID=UPI001C2E2434|nr:hypothetical protein [Streptomyces sp. BV129]MBV1947236.1 hypothetical protein [Streptomyces sp. BV129]
MITRTARRAAVLAVAAVLVSGCSSEDPAQAKEWQRDYCAKLGSWQDLAHATPGSEADGGDGQGVDSPDADDTASAGHAVIDASKRLDRAGLEDGATRILDDTVDAVRGDTGAESRAVSYCDGSGFETLVRAAG